MYVNQDHVKQRELPIGTPRSGKFPLPKKRIKLSKREQQIVTLMSEGKSYAEISKSLDITYLNVKKIFSRLKKKHG
jgi:DNA-binding NarL/FixJ family response regulator